MDTGCLVSSNYWQFSGTPVRVHHPVLTLGLEDSPWPQDSSTISCHSVRQFWREMFATVAGRLLLIIAFNKTALSSQDSQPTVLTGDPYLPILQLSPKSLRILFLSISQPRVHQSLKSLCSSLSTRGKKILTISKHLHWDWLQKVIRELVG